MEEFSDRGGKPPVVVDLCLQFIYCVLQTSYSETFELVSDVVSLGGVFLKGLGGGGGATSARSPLVSILQHLMCTRYRARGTDKPDRGGRDGDGDGEMVETMEMMVEMI